MASEWEYTLRQKYYPYLLVMLVFLIQKKLIYTVTVYSNATAKGAAGTDHAFESINKSKAMKNSS